MFKKTFIVFVMIAVCIGTMGSSVYSQTTVNSQTNADVDVEADAQSESGTEAGAEGEASSENQLIGLQGAFAQVEANTAAEVIANLSAEGYSLNEITTELKSEVVAEQEAATEITAEKRAEFKAYADALRAEITAQNEARLSALLEAKAESNTQYEEIRNEQINVLTDLSFVYEQSADTEAAFEAQIEAVKLNVRDTSSYSKLASLYAEAYAYNGIQAYVNGEQPEFDVPPVNIEDRVLVPFRAISEELNAQVQWDSETRVVSVIKGDIEVKLPIGEKTAFINGNEVELDVTAQIVDSRTVVPIRFLSEAFGAYVHWEAKANSVVIVDDSELNMEAAFQGESETSNETTQ